MRGRNKIQFTTVGAPVKVVGLVHGKATLVAHAKAEWPTPETLVVHFAGYSYNPGSRYSGLKSYVKAETVVYAMGEDGWWYSVVAF